MGNPRSPVSSIEDGGMDLIVSPETGPIQLIQSTNHSELVSSTFNFDSSDLTLRAEEDGHRVLFRIHRVMLVELEGGFKDLILAYDTLECGRVSVIPIPVNPIVVNFLLQCIYPMPDPKVQSLNLWHECYVAAKLYGVRAAVTSLRAQFDAFIHPAPLRAFAIAASVNLDDELDSAARQTFGVDRMSNSGQIEEFRHMPSSYLIALLHLHAARDRLVRDWAAQLVPIIPRCAECQNVHWTENWITLLRAELATNIRIPLEELFRIDLISVACFQTVSTPCSSCPVPPNGEDINVWADQLITSLNNELNSMSIVQFNR
ncbi:hypothetical protein DACRYDRAFT_22757 [Dacryopinax primogenitus]|uniref:BTB domain-containing protein n=1 Tax=Dacryopinax primogenitus (strain DJM 731) TaxID=1858805 RepID=M5G4W3_DACPD|nr:uncharacterized protein DACRYDRAFT_22757 [Dacryopinax primogenitus]EJU00897.1 hypothetical protein DACRYDRAFT_22757 [Dacryopinax primogenitus]